MTFDVDLFVIGGGSGGVRAARVAAESGARVALAEESRMGGTCVIRGCVPKKLMVFASGYRDSIADARSFGWDVTAGAFDWPVFQRRLSGELDRLEQIYRGLLTRAGVTLHDCRAVIEDPHAVRLAGGERITARHILVATGGRPFVPKIAQAAGIRALTSNDMFDLPDLPKSMLIVGGGYIASEFACILNGLGVVVTQYYRGAQILRGFDDEARGHVAQAMCERGIALHVGTDILEIAPQDGGTWVKTTTGKQGVFNAVLFATGRVPNTEGLGLEAAGVALGRHGQIIVDAYSQTGVPSIFALGDVTDRLNLTPVAIRDAQAFAQTVFKGIPTRADHELVASAVFTQPELGSVGLTEEVAREREPIEVYATSFRAMQHAFAGRQVRVLM